MFWQIVAIVSSFITAIVGLFAYIDKKRTKHLIQKQKEIEEKREEFKLEVSDYIIDRLQENFQDYITKEDSDLDHKIIFKQIDGLKETIDTHFEESTRSELSRLSCEIVNYAEDLRNGILKGKNSFKHIAESYDRYKKLGGNSYIESEYSYIQKYIRDNRK